LDEPTAGVDVELRREMWEMVRGLQENGVTIILTTHYIEEAQQMADRIGVIHKGRVLLVEDKSALMKKLGKRQLILHLQTPLESLPPSLADLAVERSADGSELTFTFNSEGQTGIAELLARLGQEGIAFRDLQTRESTLEEIFVGLVGRKA
jgi:ABC-2 type transport system ATP-binding protein